MLAKWIDFFFFFKSQNLVSAEICTFAEICWNLPEWTEHSKIDRNLIRGGTWGIMVSIYIPVWNILAVMGRIYNNTARINNNENKWREMTTLLFFFFFFTYKQLCCLIKYQAFTYLLLSSFTFAPLLSLPPSLQLQGFFHFFSSHLFLLLSFFLSLSSFFISFVGFVVLFYGFICFFIGGFCFGLWRGGREAAGFLFMGCVFVRWLGCVSWVFKGWDRWAWVVGSGRRRSGTSGL